MLFWYPLPGSLPPISERSPSPVRDQKAEVQRLQNLKPKLPSKDTCGEDVLYCLILLVTEGTLIRMRRTPSSPGGRPSNSNSSPEPKASRDVSKVQK